MLRKKIIFYIVSIFFISCTDNNICKGEFVYLENPGKIEILSGTKLDMEAIGFNEVTIAGNYILTFSSSNQPGLLSVCDKNTGKLLAKDLIKNGRGPNEYSNIALIKIETDTSGIKVWLTANSVQSVILLNITESLELGKPVIEAEIPIGPGGKAGILSSFMEDRDHFLLFGYSEEQKNMYVSRYDSTNEKTDTLGYLYTRPIEFTDASASYIYNQKHQYLVLGQVFFNQIYFYSLRNEAGSFSVSPDKSPVKFNLIQDTPYPDRKVYFTSSFATDDLLVFLDSQNRVLFLDWEGNILKTAELDHPATSIVLDEKTKTLYGINQAREEVYGYGALHF